MWPMVGNAEWLAGQLLSCDRGTWGFLFGKGTQTGPRVLETGRRGMIKQGSFSWKVKASGKWGCGPYR